MNHPNRPWRAFQAKWAKAKFSQRSGPAISHIVEEEVRALFCRWFGDVLQLSFSCFSLVSCLTLFGPQCKETATFKVCDIFSKEPEEEDSYKDGEPNWRWPGWKTRGKWPNSSRIQWERQQTVLRRTLALESTDLAVIPSFPHLSWTT